MTVVRARLAVTGVSRRSMLFVAGDRHVGRVWHRVMVIVRFRRGRVHSGAPTHIKAVSIPSAVLVLAIDSLASLTVRVSARMASIVSGMTMAWLSTMYA